jgi:hypothetical protein
VNNMKFHVQPLKRVRTAVEAGAAETDPSAARSEVAFIYGIGSVGVSPFECLLAGKQEGDTVFFRLAKAETDHFFSHLTALFHPLFEGRNEIFFRIRITGIETPKPREVVKAIAEAMSHGHSGGCNCGCGCNEPIAGGMPASADTIHQENKK